MEVSEPQNTKGNYQEYIRYIRYIGYILHVNWGTSLLYSGLFYGRVGINSPQLGLARWSLDCPNIWGMLKIHISGTELSN